MPNNAGVMHAIWLAGIAAFLPLCASADPESEVNDFPTLARIEYVMRCMDYHGGQIYENMYACVCSIDKIADEFRYDEFEKAEVLAQLRTTPGERAGLFREGGKELVNKYTEVTEAAEKACFASTSQAKAKNES